jgi:predicted DCC family thiol-disulfide oxidoreductase YuxK
MTAAPRETSGLPTPAERPGADVVIFDGHCRICRRQIERLARWDRGARLAFLSLHDPETARRFPDLSHDDLMRYMVVVDGQGSRHWGAEAVRYLSRRLPRLCWLAPLLHVPGTLPLWHGLYRLVADLRYRFGRQADCADGSCSLHR